MKYVQLGSSGLRVSAICVGCMSFGDPATLLAWSLPEDEALPILDYCYQSGLNFFDTANMYSNGTSEEILGKAIRQYGWRRESLVIATKLFNVVGRGTEPAARWSQEDRDNKGYVNQYGLSRKHIFDAVDASLERLGLEYIDLLQIHRFDPDTPVRETMEALHDVVRSGKVRYIGASSMWAHQLLEYQYTARINGWTEFISMQNQYSAIYREEEREMIPACQKFGMGIIPWSPIAMGFLTRPWKTFSETARGEKQAGRVAGSTTNEADQKINERIEAIAAARGVSMATVALSWALAKPFITAPIVGMSKKERVDEAISAIDFHLSDEEIRSIDEIYEPKRVSGHT
jgi:aryl-alcohol dehydrogenase-like predicted oxidoreductase